MKMTKQKVFYDKKTDVMWVLIKSGPEERYEEVTPDINLEIGEKGELLGIEIFNASKVLGSKLGIRKPDESVGSVAIPHKIR